MSIIAPHQTQQGWEALEGVRVEGIFGGVMFSGSLASIYQYLR